MSVWRRRLLQLLSIASSSAQDHLYRQNARRHQLAERSRAAATTLGRTPPLIRQTVADTRRPPKRQGGCLGGTRDLQRTEGYQDPLQTHSLSQVACCGRKGRHPEVVVIVPLRYRKRKNRRWLYTKPAYLVCTDAGMSAEQLIQAYFWRWGIEVNFMSLLPCPCLPF